ncbi:MAG: hypothetical protein VX250_12500 [Planctomycetota bacterium]|nr:hypothetical protein [Planctomycetota bacterium]
MAKLLIILVLSTLFISTVTFVLVIEGSAEPQKASQAEKKPDPAAVLGPQLRGVSTAVTKLSSDLARFNSSLKLQLNRLDSRVKDLDARVKALSEPVEEEPEENTGDRKFEASEEPEKE